MADKYQWGTHVPALGAAEGLKTQVFPSVRSGAISAVAIAFLFAPQQGYTDVQPLVYAPPTTSGAKPRTIPQVFSVSPQSADLTLQAQLFKPQQQRQGP